MSERSATDWRAAGAKLARDAAERQGLPERCDCPLTLRKIGILARLDRFGSRKHPGTVPQRAARPMVPVERPRTAHMFYG
jgi:hypothetical protein